MTELFSSIGAPGSPVKGQEDLEFYLRSLYAGVFPEEAIQRHIKDYAGLEFARQAIDLIGPGNRQEQRLLDIGSGFGSFVLLCRESGIDAVGIELSEYEVSFARNRLRQRRPRDDSEYVYRQGNALELPFSSSTFDIVTLWNVLEHIEDSDDLMEEAGRVLRPGGQVYIICPNYAAFRQEAHYLVPWFPFFPKLLAKQYLRLKGRDSRFLENAIFYTTNWGVLYLLARHNIVVSGSRHHEILAKLAHPDTIKNQSVRRTAAFLQKVRLLGAWRSAAFVLLLLNNGSMCNPFKNSIVLSARKVE